MHPESSIASNIKNGVLLSSRFGDAANKELVLRDKELANASLCVQ